jgi:hypothetical protein
MKKVELTAIGVGGVDLTRIYTQEGVDEYNEIIDTDMITSEKIMNTWDLTKTKFDYAYEHKQLTFFPQVDFSNITTAKGAFSFSSVVRFPTQLDTSNCVYMNYFARGCTALQNMPPLNLQNCVNLDSAFSLCSKIKKITLHNLQKCSNFSNIFYPCFNLEECYIDGWMQTNISVNNSNLLSAESIKYIIWHALNGANTLDYEDEGATSRILTLHATPYASWEEWKLTKPSIEDCEFLGISEEEITKYGELTWEDIALNVKLITIGK